MSKASFEVIKDFDTKVSFFFNCNFKVSVTFRLIFLFYFKYLERPKKNCKLFFILLYLRPVIKRQSCQNRHTLSNWPCTKEDVKTGTNVKMT